MRHATIVAAGVLTCTFVFTAVRTSAYGEDQPQKKTPSKKDVKDLMGKAHKGDKSPLTSLVRELNAETPDWSKVGQDAKVITDMADMLRSSRSVGAEVYYATPANYIANARDLDKAALAKDKKAASAALSGLQLSCFDCHGYRGAPK